MKIIVFGANGYVSKTFIHLAQETGHSVVTGSSAAGADMTVDFTNERSVTEMHLPGIDLMDGVFFGQGLNPGVGLEQADFNRFEQFYRVNVAGPALAVRRLLPRVRPGGCFMFLGTSAVRRGSFDPAYGASKAALWGLVNSLARYCPEHRFNLISLALVENSPVSATMPEERRRQHAGTMFGGKLINAGGVARMALEIMGNGNVNRADIHLDGGMVT